MPGLSRKVIQVALVCGLLSCQLFDTRLLLGQEATSGPSERETLTVAQASSPQTPDSTLISLHFKEAEI